LLRRSLLSQAVVVSGSVDSDASKKDGAPIRPSTDRAQGRDVPAFLTEEALLRLVEGLRAQREQLARSDQPPKPDGATELHRNNEERRFSEPEAASLQPGAQALGKAQKRTADWLIVRTQIGLRSENPPLAPGADQLKIRAEEPAPLHEKAAGFFDLCFDAKRSAEIMLQRIRRFVGSISNNHPPDRCR
jgi:hypothetical protein